MLGLGGPSLIHTGLSSSSPRVVVDSLPTLPLLGSSFAILGVTENARSMGPCWRALRPTLSVPTLERIPSHLESCCPSFLFQGSVWRRGCELLGQRLPARGCPGLRPTPSSPPAPQAKSAAASASLFANAPASIILGIETSCDDTGAAVVTSDGRILGEALASQGAVHAEWGGVVPSLARDEHQKAIDRVVGEALEQAHLTPWGLSAVAVTIGPGLSLCLRVGVVKARAVCAQYGLPLVPVHHMEAHALVARLTAQHPPHFPFLVLLVSGGHNLLLLAHAVGRYTQLGTTLDDAIGEAFDKTARLLGLDMSGCAGAALEELASHGDPTRFTFSLPLKHSRTCDFSYAGLKTGLARAIEREAPLAASVPLGEAAPDDWCVRADLAAAFQSVAVRHLSDKTRRALALARELEPGVTALVVSGGVAANGRVRQQLLEDAAEQGLPLVCPPPRLCTDNGVMVAWAGVERFGLGLMQPPPPLDESPDTHVELRPRWPLGDLLHSAHVPPRSAKKKRLFPSLTSETVAAFASQHES